MTFMDIVRFKDVYWAFGTISELVYHKLSRVIIILDQIHNYDLLGVMFAVLKSCKVQPRAEYTQVRKVQLKLKLC